MNLSIHHYCLLLWGACTAGLCDGQTSEQLYFEKYLTTNVITPAPAGHKLKANEIVATRQQTWAAWVAAVKAQTEQKLIDEEPLDSARTGSLNLPDSLEQNAVMPYYWGTKGALSPSGNTSVPTFIYLHGSGPKAAEWAASLSWAKVFADAPSRYFIPQIPREGSYYRWWQRSKQWAYRWLWRQLMVHEDIDPNRIYVFGISEGGYGSQRLASFYADYLAAAGPMAGGEPLQNAPAENLGHVGFSLLTGEKDDMFCRNIYTQLTADALDSLQHVYPESYAHRITLIPGKGHGFDYRPTTPWLMQFKRNPWPRHFVWEDFDMDGVHRTGFYNLRIEKRPCDTLRTRYDVNISEDGNVDIQVRNVTYVAIEKEPRWGFTLQWRKELTQATGGELTLYLDEHLVDLNRKVVVTVNGNVVHSGKLSLHTGAMQESLATFSDPMRIYPAAIRVKY